MTNFTQEAEGIVDEGALITTRARLVKEDGTQIAASDLSSISLAVYNFRDLATKIVIGGSSVTDVTVATSLATGTLSTSNNWVEDEDGYNFSHSWDSSSFLTGGNRYRMQYKITTSSLGIIWLPVLIAVRNLS